MKHSIIVCVSDGLTLVPVSSPIECEDVLYDALLKIEGIFVVELPKIVAK